jgi:imidazole glycerol phosphate synthase glutamine amidotransferase subunit
MSRRVAVVRTGLAGAASILAALRRIEADPFSPEDPSEVEETTFLVLHGAGTFAQSMASLQKSEFVEPLRTRIEYDRPTIAIGLGMHILFETCGPWAGVGAVPGAVGTLPSPHIGWNTVGGEDATLPEGLAYFCHTMATLTEPEGWLASWSDHGGPVVAAVQRGTVLGCQFHPELSADYGERVLRSWLMEWAPW